MTARFMANLTVIQLYGITPGNTFDQEFSIVSLENILFDILSFSFWSIEKLWDIFRIEITNLIAASKPFQLKWYIETALAYQQGYGLTPMLEYDNTGLTAEQIAASKIIAKVAFEKVVINGHGVLRCKVVKEVGDELEKLTPVELQGFNAYINTKTGFGLPVISISRDHDTLVLNMKIWYDPLVINALGQRRDGTDNAPIITAIKAYLKSLEFNGELVLTHLVDHLQKVEGVKIPKVIEASSNMAGLTSDQSIQSNYAGDIEETRVAFSGWMRIDEVNSQFEYIERS